MGRGGMGSREMGSGGMGSREMGSGGMGRGGMRRRGMGSGGMGEWRDGGVEGWVVEGWGVEGWGVEGWGEEGWGVEGWGVKRWGVEGWGVEGWGVEGWGSGGWGSGQWGVEMDGGDGNETRSVTKKKNYDQLQWQPHYGLPVKRGEQRIDLVALTWRLILGLLALFLQPPVLRPLKVILLSLQLFPLLQFL